MKEHHSMIFFIPLTVALWFYKLIPIISTYSSSNSPKNRGFEMPNVAKCSSLGNDSLWVPAARLALASSPGCLVGDGCCGNHPTRNIPKLYVCMYVNIIYIYIYIIPNISESDLETNYGLDFFNVFHITSQALTRKLQDICKVDTRW